MKGIVIVLLILLVFMIAAAAVGVYIYTLKSPTIAEVINDLYSMAGTYTDDPNWDKPGYQKNPYQLSLNLPHGFIRIVGNTVKQYEISIGEYKTYNITKQNDQSLYFVDPRGAMMGYRKNGKNVEFWTKGSGWTEVKMYRTGM